MKAVNPDGETENADVQEYTLKNSSQLVEGT